MKVLEYGLRTSKHDNWTTKIECGETAEEGCGAQLEVSFKDIFSVEKQMAMGQTAVMYYCKCPMCHVDNGISYKQIPNHANGILRRTKWLKNSRQALLSQLEFEFPEDWERIKTELTEEGVFDSPAAEA